MPPAGRAVRSRAQGIENDENAGTTRLTRAKAAALNHESAASDLVKKPLTRTKSTTTSTTAGQSRKRAALGDVSNVVKQGTVTEKNGKAGAKPGLVKAAAPTKVQKVSRSQSTRNVLGNKDKNASDLKRPASGSGVHGPASKKRNTNSTSKSIEEEESVETQENVAPAENTNVYMEVKTKHEAVAPKEEAQFQPRSTTPKLINPEVVDLDLEDIEDPLMVAEYVNEIFDYLLDIEGRTMASEDYMDLQTELEWKMRGILVDWLLEVHGRFRLLPETLFLAVNIIDRFLSCKIVQLDRLQLVGVTAMFIASKYEEVLSPHVQNFRHVADDGFTEEEILSAERFVLAALNYDLSYPNPMNFLRRISKADAYDIQTRTLGKYLLEISCLDHHFIGHPPSQVAAAAMYFARLVLEKGEWDPTLAHYSGYTEEELWPCFQLMVDYLHGPVLHEAFFKKYASKKFLKASIVLRQWTKKYYHDYFGMEAPSTYESSSALRAAPRKHSSLSS
ncbi:A/B/D/E cyclin [Eremomyces bilateralis CBS 781.70]|uniref:A/B/D/E cyclin n=1 Tax=Eremomyces bilateralis CBS 781.70 TaxID=1392243 RepID=A0A6G1GGR2_9PEZI|nr:A/B/D/E cyclin [Eremomyces bilateralis CBS 781.70]KAF1817258.1 A/B/D/E cyclin [Eremomyces bilateralis CBS 781.70]